MKPTLASGSVTLLPLKSTHAADYIRIANDPTIATRVNNPIPFERHDFDDLLQKFGDPEKKTHFLWMIACEGVPCGAINALDLRSVGLFQGGYWVEPAFLKKGIATTALTLVRDFLFRDFAAIRLQAIVEPDNKASMRVLEKCGYQREGLLRRFYPSQSRGLIDVVMYAAIKE